MIAEKGEHDVDEAHRDCDDDDGTALDESLVTHPEPNSKKNTQSASEHKLQKCQDGDEDEAVRKE